MSLNIVMSVTDELIHELADQASKQHYVSVLGVDVACLLSERAKLKRENAELGQALCESIANDIQAMRYLSEIREAIGDDGRLMLPELIESVRELKSDAERLDSLDKLCEAYGFEGVHEGNRWVIDGPFRSVRDAIDSLPDDASRSSATR